MYESIYMYVCVDSLKYHVTLITGAVEIKGTINEIVEK